MSEETRQIPPLLARFSAQWSRLSARLVPILAVVTAFLFGIPLIMLTVGSVGKGLQVSGVAYSALIEGTLGVVINDLVSRDDFDVVRDYNRNVEISRDGFTRQARPIERVATVGADNIRRYAEVLEAYPTLTTADLSLIGANMARLIEVGTDRLNAVTFALAQIEEANLSRPNVRNAVALVSGKSTLSPADREALAELLPNVATMEDEELRQLQKGLGVVEIYTLNSSNDYRNAWAKMNEVGLALGSGEAGAIQEIATHPQLSTERVIETIATLEGLEAAGVSDPNALGEQLRLLGNLFDAGLLTSPTVRQAIDEEIDLLDDRDLVVRRSGGTILVGAGMANEPIGLLYDAQRLPILYVRLGGSAFLFVPDQLATTLIKAIPYIITGLAVALGFKAGVFNIGAEGQLHFGAIIATWVGFSLVGVPGGLHILLILIAGILGGLFWGAIPGLLRAYAGANEVVSTIMMNFIALRFIDWLIKADPPILRDPTSSVPRTPPISEAAHLPTFSQFPVWVFLLAGVLVAVFMAWGNRKQLSLATLRRPLILGVLTAVVGVFLSMIDVRGTLHLGFVVMVLAIVATDWFLMRTTLGFELRTVGMNQNAARYAGMNVALNVVLALGLAGALAGLSGAVEIAGKEYAMVPNLFAGFGFDAISVALLARSNPRNIFWSGFLWGGLLSAAGLMQIRADISIDLVRIVQALIIMFVAADQIIRFIYRISAPSGDDKLMFVKG